MVMMSKETATALVAAIQEVAALEGQQVGFDGRFGRLTDRCDRSITTRIGWFKVPTIEEFLNGLHYEIKKTKKCTYYGADRNEDWTITIGCMSYEPWPQSLGVKYPALDEEGARALIVELKNLAEKAKALN